jgi:NADPH-dependent curcumin reductase CurA
MSDASALPREGRVWLLASRPHGEPSPDNFQLTTQPVGELEKGEVLVRNQFLSVDPYMRGRMNDARSYTPPFQIGKPLDGHAAGTVIASRSPRLKEGQAVSHRLGWRELAKGPAEMFRPIGEPDLSPSLYLGVLGMPGLTAYVGLFDVARFRAGGTVFVSGAAGAVGSVVGQLARIGSARRVIGSAGSADKIADLTGELGFDAAFNYKDGPVAEQLDRAAPDGIDVYFDNVGGDHLEAAIGALTVNGRIAVCGMVSQYSRTEPVLGPRNLMMLVGKRLHVQGFLVGDHSHAQHRFERSMAQWVREGRILVRETFVDGIENMPQAFIDMLRGANIGKMIVRLT